MEESGTTYYVANSSQIKSGMSVCWKKNSDTNLHNKIDSISNNSRRWSYAGIWISPFGLDFCETSDKFAFWAFPYLVGESYSLFSWNAPKPGSLGTLSDVFFTSINIQITERISAYGLRAVMSRVAFALSKYARDHSDYAISGRTIVGESFVYVKLPWPFLPATLVALTSLFLVSTTSVSHRRRLSPWTTSILPHIFNGPGDEILAEYNKLSSLSEMEIAAATTKIALRVSETEGRMVLESQL